MPRKFYGKPRKTQVDDETRPFINLVSLMPRDTVEILRKMSEETGISMSRLVCIAVDNELDITPAFNYPTDLPDTPYVANAFAAEASKIFDLIRKMDGPTTRETLLLCRRSAGILDRRTFLQGYRELLETGLIEERRPKKLRPGQGEDYRLTVIKGLDTRVSYSNRYRKPEGLKDADETQ